MGTILRTIGQGLLALGAILGHGLAFLGRAFVALLQRSRAAAAIVVVVAILLVGGLVDFGLNAGKAYQGVHVGTLDVSGKSVDEIATLIDETYASRLNEGSVVAYASEEAMNAQQNTVTDAEQQTAEEENANRTSWSVDASTLAASLPSEDLAQAAVAVGREDGGFFARVASFFGGWTIKVAATYGESELETFAAAIDESIGSARVDFGVEVVDGVARVTDGVDGNMVNRDVLADQLDTAFFLSEEGQKSFVAYTEYAPIRIDQAAAQTVCDDINAALSGGVRFIEDGASWNVDESELGSWISTRIDDVDGTYTLVPFIDETKAKPAIVSFAKEQQDGNSLVVSFEVAEDDSVVVHAQGAGELPYAAETSTALNDALFGENGKAAQARGGATSTDPVEIAVTMGAIPETLSFDDALSMGVIEGFSTYTTTFSTGSGSENRNHNIALAASLLNNSVVEPGGSWSFNDTAGECSAETGFLDAGSIVDGEYTSEEGGGICQVATTVFNAVYDSGLPITTRHNHSLYIATYPAGRDAAVSWPDLDLVWQNDTDSGVLLRLTCDDSSVTATLYGVNPGYLVSTEVGEWEEGEKYTTITERDDTLSAGTSYVKTRGTDGSKITIIRTVADSTGTVLWQDAFASSYDPIDEVIVAGPEATSSTTESS